MKIAVYYNLPYGGAKRAVFEQVKGLKQLNHQVDIYRLDSSTDEFSPEIIANNEYKYIFKSISFRSHILSRLLRDFQVFFALKLLHRKIAQHIDEKKYDIVLVHTDSYTQAPFILRYLKSKSVYYCLEPLRMTYEYSLRVPTTLHILNKLYEHFNRYIRKEIDLRNARSAKYSLAISYFCKAYMIQVYDCYPLVSYLGVDQIQFHPMKISKKRQVLFVAGKDQLVGYDLAVSALALIPKKIRPELKIVYGIKKSERIKDRELVKIYNESIVTLSLSRLDTFGLVPLESMACATPVIATNVAGYRELVVDNKTGYLVEFDAKEIADKIMFLMNNPRESERMGKEGRKWVENSWRWEYQIKDLEKKLLKFINENE